jgi:hypothetical protein
MKIHSVRVQVMIKLCYFTVQKQRCNVVPFHSKTRGLKTKRNETERNGTKLNETERNETVL